MERVENWRKRWPKWHSHQDILPLILEVERTSQIFQTFVHQVSYKMLLKLLEKFPAKLIGRDHMQNGNGIFQYLITLITASHFTRQTCDLGHGKRPG